jgi:hypothetical protein
MTYFASRFGVSREFFAPFTFEERGGEIWATTALTPLGLTPCRPLGLRILRRMPHSLKPTSLFLRVLNRHITTSRVEIKGLDLLQRFLLGQTIETSLSDGFVAVSFRGDVLGCGSAKNGRLRALIPTQKRRELLNSLPFEGSVSPDASA